MTTTAFRTEFLTLPGWPTARTLATLLEHELAHRRPARHLREARLIAGKTLDTFDFAAAPMVSPARINQMLTAACVRPGDRGDAMSGVTMIKDREHVKLERLSFFSDAVFAIAMTLLVIEVRLPELHGATDGLLAQALVSLMPNYIGFIISFLVIGRFWTGHHRLMAMIDAADPALVRANLLLLMAIAFMPFPTAVLSDYSLLRVAIGFYTAYLMVVGLANVRVITVALRHLARNDPEAVEDARQLRRSMWSPIIIAGAGFAAGMVSPAAGLIAMIVVTPIALLLLTRLAGRSDRR